MYPYEFYATILNLYTKKGNKEKVALIIEEMRRYMNIMLTPAKYGEDNRDWYIDKENHSISQSLASVKGLGQNVSDDLEKMRDLRFDYFVDLLYYILMNTSIKKDQIDTLICVGYFKMFGGSKKLLTLAEEFRDGKFRIKKGTKSYEKRLEELHKIEDDLPDENLSLIETVQNEDEYLGLCFSYDKSAKDNQYIVTDVDDKYGVNVEIYSLQRGTRGKMRVKKDIYNATPLAKGTVFNLLSWKTMPRTKYVNGKRVRVEGEDKWLTSYSIEATPQNKKKDK